MSGFSDFVSSFSRSFRTTVDATPRPAQSKPQPTSAQTPSPQSQGVPQGPSKGAEAPPPPKDQTHLSSGATTRASSAANVSLPFSEETCNLSHLKTAQEARQELRQIGFVSGPEGRENLNYQRLGSQTAESVKHVHGLLKRDSQAGHNNELPLFGLRVAGATLSNPAEREKFIKGTLLNSPKESAGYLDQMSRMLKRTQNPTIEKALLNALSQANSKQTKDFLYEAGFLMSDGMEEDGPSINPKAVEHLPKAIVTQMIENLSKNGGVFNSNAPIINGLKYRH
ncbi:MAG: hypothetical protein IV090_08345 [Candidatus Sericytochromatia bacterium]|nr:hypothetical protein [Candidatus Sericytochromatia bacterium]